jgi:hypothetical protein
VVYLKETPSNGEWQCYLVLSSQERLEFLCLLPALPSIRLVSFGLRAMGARWIQSLADGRAPFLDGSLSFVRVCVLLRKARRRCLPEDGIRFSPSSPRPGGASSIVGGVWRCVSGGSIFGGSDLRYTSSAAVVVLVRWSYGALAPAREGR